MNSNPAHPTAAGLNPGDKLEKYEVVEQIGAGGMSVVWKAFDRLLNKHVAIKQLYIDPDAGESDDQLRERFAQEAQIQKRVSLGNPHLVQIIDFVSEPRGYFIIMEYVDGITLEQLLEQNPEPMDPAQAMGIVGGTALALSAIHKHGVLHRDLKPSNILLPRAGGLKLCDFGLASLIEDQDALSVGSVRYMAPELFQQGQVDPRADIYSLGMIAYEMLLGRRKFGESFRMVLRDQRNQALRWLKWHTNSRVTAPPLSESLPDMPPTLDELVARMMEKDPAKRVASTDELIEAIRRHFSGEAAEPDEQQLVAASHLGVDPAEATAPLPQRSRTPMLIAATVIFWTIAAIGGFAVWNALTPDTAEEIHARAEDRYQDARDLYRDGEYRAALVIFQDLAARFPADPVLGAGSLVRADLCQARIAMQDQDYQTALTHLEKVRDRNLLDPDLIGQLIDETTIGLAFQRAFAEVETHIAANRYAEARAGLRELRQFTVSAQATQRLERLASRIETEQREYQIANVLRDAGQAESDGRRADAIAVLVEGSEDFQDQRITSMLSRLRNQQRVGDLLRDAQQAEQAGNLADAINSYRQIQQVRGDQSHADRIASLQAEQAYQQGVSLMRQGELQQARQHFQQAVQLDSNHDGAHRQIARIESMTQKDGLVAAGDQAAAEGKLAEAREFYTRAISDPFGPDASIGRKIRDIDLQQALRRGQAALDDRQLDAAETAYRDVLELDPDNQAATEGLASLGRWRQYESLMAEASQSRTEGDLRQAKILLGRAQMIFNTPEVREQQADVEYESLIANARTAIAAENWENARGWLRTAAKIRVTEELTRLRSEIDKHAPTLETEQP